MNIEDLQIVFITYNRSHLLKRSFERIKESENLRSVKTVCSDDGSSPDHVAAIRTMGFDRLAITEKNGGLGYNNNKGLRACEGKYQLMIQDDCMLLDDRAVLRALEVLENDEEVGMVRLHGDPSAFPLLHRVRAGVEYWVADHQSKNYKSSLPNLPRRRVYSDQPHVRRRELHTQGVGYYAEGLSMERTEMDYEDRFDAQSRFYVAFLSPGRMDVFEHDEHGESLRANKLRYRLDSLMSVFATSTGLKQTAIFPSLKRIYRNIQRALESIGLLK